MSPFLTPLFLSGGPGSLAGYKSSCSQAYIPTLSWDRAMVL